SDLARDRWFDAAAERSLGAGEPDLLRPGRGLTRGDRRLPVGARTDPPDSSAVSGHAHTLAAREAHGAGDRTAAAARTRDRLAARSEEHTSELQSRFDLVCRLLLEKKKKKTQSTKIQRLSRSYASCQSDINDVN